MQIDKETIEALAYGGVILGGGGGGAMADGKKLAEEAVLKGAGPQLIDLAELADNAVILTISAVGAPSATEQFTEPKNYIEIVELFERHTGKKVDALMTNEMGGGSSFNAFIPATLKNLPMVDASCNGRAHPLGTMGAMGLAETVNYVTCQTAIGGNPATNRYIELVTQGSVEATSTMVRQAAIAAGGLVVVARNAVSKDYAKKHAAMGTITQSYEVGKAFLAGKTAEEKVHNVAEYLGGTIICQGQVEHYLLVTEGGLDRGSFSIQDNGDTYTLHIWNEYMAIEKNQIRKSTFPDLLMSFDTKTGMPVTTAELKEGQSVYVLQVPYQKLALGAGMFEQSGYEKIEETLGISILPYVEELLQIK